MTAPTGPGLGGDGLSGHGGSLRRVAVTGLGPITAVGTGVEGLWDGLRRGRSPVDRITRFDASP